MFKDFFMAAMYLLQATAVIFIMIFAVIGYYILMCYLCVNFSMWFALMLPGGLIGCIMLYRRLKRK